MTLKHLTCHKVGIHVIKHELHVMNHVSHVKKHKTRKLFKTMKCEIWYKNIFVKRIFFEFIYFPKQTRLQSAVRVGYGLIGRLMTLTNFTRHKA